LSCVIVEPRKKRAADLRKVQNINPGFKIGRGITLKKEEAQLW
jgi:hypothetical protein